MAILLQGCYETLPLQEGPAPTMAGVQLVLNDKGRDELSTKMGSAVDRIEGTITAQNSSTYTIAVSEVYTLGGSTAKWSGESVTIAKEGTGGYRIHRFNETRTIVLAVAITAAVVVFFATSGLVGSGGGNSPTSPTQPGQTQLIHP
jgi:phage tail tape-measure protein